MKTTKLIFSPQLAKFLLSLGNFEIIDLKKKHGSEEMVFVFGSYCDFNKAINDFKSIKI